MINDHSTIIALASAVGVSGVAVIRLAGPKSFAIAKQCLYKRKEVDVNTVYYGVFKDPRTDEHIDQVCYFLFKGPRSFTGEDTVEIQCHGSHYVIKAIIECCVDLGARLAQPGEFTQRAFINGKINLTQAESIIDLIHSESKLQHQVSLNRVEGKLYSHIKAFRREFMLILEQLEGSIDFPDEVPAIDRDQVITTLSTIREKLETVLSFQDYGKVIQNGFHCVLVGVPNVGKSSLFNALLNQERSIVTDIAGTTRDYVTESIDFNGLTFHIYDTAGLREATDTVEYLGIQKVKDILKKADLILVLVDDSAESLEVMHELTSYEKKAIIYTKSDSIKYKNLDQKDCLFAHKCSVVHTDSVLDLKKKLYSVASQSEANANLELICNIRQHECIKKIHRQCSQLIHNLELDFHDDVFSIEVRQCVELCSELAGDSLTEEVLDGIFSRFCVGK